MVICVAGVVFCVAGVVFCLAGVVVSIASVAFWMSTGRNFWLGDIDMDKPKEVTVEAASARMVCAQLLRITFLRTRV